MSQNPSKKNILVTVLSLLLVASVGGNVFQFFHTREVVITHEKTILQMDSITLRKHQLESEYNSAIEELNQYKGQNARMDSLLTEANFKIDEQRKKIAKLIDQNEDYQILRMRMDEMRAEKEFYLAEIKRLTDENNKLKSEVTTLSVQVDQKTSENKILKGKVDEASKLRIVSMTPKPINLTSNNKEKDTDKASKTDRISISFVIGENPLGESGKHTVYLRIFNPEGYLLSDGSVKKLKTEKGDEIPYSRSLSVDFDGSKLSKTITWDQDVFSAGTYKIEMYIDGYPAGNEKFSLY